MYPFAVQVVCDHCGNQVYAAHGDTGIVDELVKRAGWRPRAPRQVAVPHEVDHREVAAELRDIGLDVDDGEVSEWLDEEAAMDGGLDAPRGLARVATWLERKEASVTPVKRVIFDRATASSIHRGDIAWQRTPEGLLACSGHCFEQLSLCTRCGIARTAPEHRDCTSFVPRCDVHRAPGKRSPER